jgi:hypothetical protein
MMLTNRQLHAGTHLPPVRTLAALDAVGKTATPNGGRAQCYTLSLPAQDKSKPWAAAGKVTMRSVLGEDELGLLTTSLF